MSGETWTGFHLVPDDVLFFRDGKPSARGEDHYLRSLFPPHPSTLYGALRTRRLLDEDIELQGLNASTWRERLGDLVAELGEWGGFGSLALRGPWLVLDGQRLLPAPLDLGVVVEPRAEPPQVKSVVRFRLQPAEEEGGSSHPLALLAPFQAGGDPWPEDEREPRPAEGWYLLPDGIEAWRQGGVPDPACFVHPRSLWKEEARTGVGLEKDRRASAKGLLYTFGFLRLLPGVALGFEVTGTALEPGSRVRLGGEGRTAVIEPSPSSPFPGRGGDLRAERLCLSLITPGLSWSGGYPPGFAADRLEAEVGGRRFRLVGAVLPGFVTIGGWDLARHQAKPLRRAIPAGSVFLLDPVDGEPAELADFKEICLSDYDDESLAQQGFGLTVAGVSF